MSDEATPRPWTLVHERQYDGGDWSIAASGHYVITSSHIKSDLLGTERADMELIVRAVNSHDDLLDVILAYLEPAGEPPDEIRKRARAAVEGALGGRLP